MKNLLIAFCLFAFAGTTFAATTAVNDQQKNNENSLFAQSKMSPLQIGDNDKDKKDGSGGGI